MKIVPGSNPVYSRWKMASAPTLYQFNVTVPNIAPGDVALGVDAGGVTLNQNCFITVGQ